MSLAIAPVSVSSPLVTVPRYRELTGDTTTDETTVTARLEDAQRLVEEYLRRPIERAERTERLRLYRYEGTDSGFDGGWAVYPRATPIDAVATTGYTALGAALVGVSPDAGPLSYGISPTTVGYATVTYTGGWTEATLPLTIARELARTAKALASPAASGVPAGATSVKVGDLSIGFGKEGATSGGLDATSRSELRRYIRRRAA